jgi:uroporphyrinogen-III synthase
MQPARRLIVTRPAAQAQAWVQGLWALGVEALALPLIGIEAAADVAPLHAAWEGLHQHRLVMFVSANAVQQFFAHRPTAVAALAWPERCLAGATGPGTVAALHAAGVPAANVVAPRVESELFDSEALWQTLLAHPHGGADWQGRSALVVRGEQGRNWLADALRDAGAAVQTVAAYRRTLPAWSAAEQGLLHDALAAPEQHLWLLSSSEAVGHLGQLAPQANWGGSAAVATHPRITQAARSLGFGALQEVAPTLQAVAAAVNAVATAGGATDFGAGAGLGAGKT